MSAEHPAYLDLAPIKRMQGMVRLPGSKSISNRTLLLAALAEGTTEVKDLLESDDTSYMLDALRMLAFEWQRTGQSHDYRVTGAGGAIPVKKAKLFLGNAGTAFRPLTAALAFAGGEYELDGVQRMRERPIGDLVDALRMLGAQIEYRPGNENYPPLHIKPAAGPSLKDVVQIYGGESSQFVTGLLMAAPLIPGLRGIEVVGDLISRPYIEITLELMARFGVKVKCEKAPREGVIESFTIPQGAKYRSPGVIHVEGDASSASYFLAAGAISGTPVRVEGIGRDSIQGDRRFAEVIEQMGGEVRYGDNWIEAISDLRSRGGKLKPITGDFNHIPDAAMTIAILALFADGPSWLQNIGSWRVKETDRIAAMATELRKVGANVYEGTDNLRITPPIHFQRATIDTYDDHRMAMCFSLVALGGVPVRINDPACVGKTFPQYFAEFERLSQR
jgi:3-phosphoshikimate 1-carboxyvinyltransferase